MVKSPAMVEIGHLPNNKQPSQSPPLPPQAADPSMVVELSPDNSLVAGSVAGDGPLYVHGFILSAILPFRE